MLRVNVIASAKAAETYYVGNADYYLDENALPARWQGEAARQLGLQGEVTREHFAALCSNKHPLTGKSLTAAMRSNRRSGYDFTFTASKSVSILLALAGDDRIAKAFQASVQDAMQLIEQDAAARVRKQGQDGDRMTGNLVWSAFTHTLSRPTGEEGVPQPALHAHVVVQNVTFDHEEGIWKALQAGALKANAPHYQAAFRAKLAENLQHLGYELETWKGDFEIKGVPSSAIRKMSKRTEEVNALAARLGVTRPDAKAKLGATSRRAKNRQFTWRQLKDKWHASLTHHEVQAIHRAHEESRSRQSQFVDRTEGAFQLALDHLLERQSAIPERTLIAETLRRGVGRTSLKSVRDKLATAQLIRGQFGGVTMVTTREAMAEEKQLVSIVKSGRHTQRAVANKLPDGGEHLNPGQVAAVLHLLSTPHRFASIRGVAGSGKTTLLKAAVRGYADAGFHCTVLAPTSAASRVTLRQDGIHHAETLQRFLVDARMQNRAAGNVVVLDEGSLTGMQDMLALARLAQTKDFRVAILGDRRQHQSVLRGNVLAVLEDFGGVKSVEVTEILRQQGNAKAIVAMLARGEAQQAFDQLQRDGAVSTSGYDVLATEYVAAFDRGDSILAVCPTHAEGQVVTAAIREQLRARGSIQGPDTDFLQLIDTQSTQADRRDDATYELGLVAEFLRNKGRFKSGQRVVVDSANQSELISHASAIRLYRRQRVPLAAGDVVRFTKGGKTLCGRRIENGSCYRVSAVTDTGELRLHNGWRISSTHGHLAHDWVVTSYAAQSRTADTVLVAQGTASLPATNATQFYVSVSRARRSIRVFADAPDRLRKALGRVQANAIASQINSQTGRLRLSGVAALFAQRLRRLRRSVGTLKAARQHCGPPAPSKEVSR